MSLPRLSWPGVSARRLSRNRLAAPTGEEPAAIAAAMCGVHAQILSAAELSLGIRIAGGTRTDVQDALWRERSLVKTFGPRGTVHLLPAPDLPMWTAALAAVPRPRSPFAEGTRTTPEQDEAIIAALDGILADAELTVEEVDDAVGEALGEWAVEKVMPAFQTFWPRWRQAIGLAAARGVLCFGPNRGRKVTYTSPRRRLPGFEVMGAEEGLAGVVAAYLHAYGPAAPGNFAKWFGGTEAWAAGVFASLGARLEEVEFEGEGAWVNAGDVEMPGEPVEGVRLLPYFDAYAIACRPRQRLFPGKAYERALARGQAGNFPVVLVDGVVAGVWHLRRSGKRMAVTVEMLEDAGMAKRVRAGLEEQVRRIGEFGEGTANLVIGEVTVGPHA